VKCLEEYWAKGEPSLVFRASRLFAELAVSHDKITRLADLTAVLAILAPEIARDPARAQSDTFYPYAALVERVYQSMKQSPIFNAFTIDMHWEVRARESIGQHIRWWMRGIAQGFRREDDGTAAW